MPRYNVEITPGNSVQIEANTPEEARALIERQIKALNTAKAAQIAAAPALDDLLFDYERGVQDKRLRSLLATADNIREREQVAEKYLGPGGFTYTTKQELAATAEGLARMGLEPEYITLTDGSKIAKNVVIDERSFDLGGDLADLAGVAGPIIGAVAALTPQTRIMGAIMKALKFFNGGPRTGRILAASAGSAAGKGVEEAIEIQEGLQLQNQEEINALLRREATFGALGQGLGEAIGLGYGVLLGKQKPFDNVRLYRQAVQGRNLDDVMKLDAKLKREATDKEIEQAIKDGIVTRYTEKGLFSQGAIGRPLAARTQAMTEQVIGNQRVEETKKYLFRNMTDLFGKLNKENVENVNLQELIKRYAGRTAMTPQQKAALDRQVKESLDALKSSEIESIQGVEKLLDDIMEDFADMPVYRDRIDKTQIGEIMRDTLTKARNAVDENMNAKYVTADQQLSQLSDPRISKQLMEKVVRPKLDEAQKLLDKYKNQRFDAEIKIGDDLDAKGQAETYLEEIVKRMRERMEKTINNPGDPEGFTFVALRNTISSLKEQNSLILKKSLPEKLLRDFIGLLDEAPPGSSSTGILQDMANINTVGSKLAQVGLTTDDGRLVSRAVNNLFKANDYARKMLTPFDNVNLLGILRSGKRGAFDIDEVYKRGVQSGKSQDLRDIFKAVRNYDDYIQKVKPKGQVPDNEIMLRNEMQKKLISDGFFDAYDYGTDTIDFAKFATFFRNFDRQSPGKLRELFSGSNLNSDEFLNILGQLNKLKPNIKPKELQKLITNFSKNEEGLAKTAAGRSFIEGLEKLVKNKSDLATFEANQIVSKLPEATTEEVVSKIFTPQGASNIKLVRETVGPEAFKEIQNNAMNKILQRAIDFDGLAKKGDIAKIFQADKFNNILRSYGDETLEEMFGLEVAQGLKNYGKTLEIMTAKEAGRGGSAGTLIAASIAINAFNPALWPTVAGFAVLRAAFSSPTFLKMMARTDKSATVQVLEVFERLFRLAGVRDISQRVMTGGEMLQEEAGKALEGTNLDEELMGQTDQIINQARNVARDVPVPISTAQVEMPEIQPLDLPQLGVGLSPERIEFAERIAGRPVV